MRKFLVAAIVLPVLVLAQPVGSALRAKTVLPVGKYKVEFANGVNETCAVEKDGGVHVSEPLRSSAGKVVSDGKVATLSFFDDRVERWTPVGERFVVEHWCPASARYTSAPVVGIADRVPPAPPEW